MAWVHVEFFDQNRVVVHPELAIPNGAIKGWDARNQYYFQMLASLAKHYGVDLDQPWENCRPNFANGCCAARATRRSPFPTPMKRAARSLPASHSRASCRIMERRFRETDSSAVREELAKFRRRSPCPACKGTRLRREARYVFIGEGDARRAIYQMEGTPFAQVQNTFRASSFTGAKGEIGDKIVKRDRAASAVSGRRRAGRT